MLPLQIGINTRAALLAIDLAVRAVQGPRHFLEGDFGYFTLFDSEWDPSAFDLLGTRSEMTQLSHKPFPSGRATHRRAKESQIIACGAADRGGDIHGDVAATHKAFAVDASVLFRPREQG